MRRFHTCTMAEVGRGIADRNERRSPKFEVLMPDQLECSVAV